MLFPFLHDSSNLTEKAHVIPEQQQQTASGNKEQETVQQETILNAYNRSDIKKGPGA